MTAQWDLQRGIEAPATPVRSKPDSEELRDRQRRAAGWVGAVAGLLLGGIIAGVVGVPEGAGAAIAFGTLGWLRGRYSGVFQRDADLAAPRAAEDSSS